MNNTLLQLHDIEGLDPINAWPLAIGWWLVIVIFTIIVLAVVFMLYRIWKFRRSWRNTVFRSLIAMEKDLSTSNIHSQAITLSVLIRRIAIHQYSRHTCAGLTGQQWLDWLSAHDPAQFNWHTNAAWIIDIPYASPHHVSFTVAEIRPVIKAIKKWVKSC